MRSDGGHFEVFKDNTFFSIHHHPNAESLNIICTYNHFFAIFYWDTCLIHTWQSENLFLASCLLKINGLQSVLNSLARL